MDIVKKSLELKSQVKKTHIYFIGDLHIGNVNFDRESFKRLIKRISDEEDSYIVGMGDYLECININDKRFDPSSIDKTYKINDLSDFVMIQARDFITLMQPVKHKILTLVSGNHESKFTHVYNVDIFSYICNQLNVTDKINNIGILALHLWLSSNGTKKVLSLYLNHGDGGNGKREGYPLNILHDVFRWSNCDINIMGHIHQLVEDHKMFNGVNTTTYKFQQTKKLYGVSGTFLKTYVQGNQNYFEHKGRFDSTIGCLRLDIQLTFGANDDSVSKKTIKTLMTLNKVMF